MHARARASFKIRSLKPEARQRRIVAFSLRREVVRPQIPPHLQRHEFTTLLGAAAA